MLGRYPLAAAPLAAQGAPVPASTGSSAGLGAATGAGCSLATSKGSAAGLSTVAARGMSLGTGTGSAAGSSGVSGKGQSGTITTGTAAGVSTVSAQGQSKAQATGSAPGVSGATGRGSSYALGKGSSLSISTASAGGRSSAMTIGLAQSVSTAAARGGSLAGASGTALGLSSVAGAGGSQIEAAYLLWPLAPNWREPFSVSYEFKTDIFTSRSGREQRRAQRTTPRKTLKFTVTRTAGEARTFRSFVTRFQGPLINVADSSRFARVLAAAPVNTSVLLVDDATGSWIDGGQRAVLYFANLYIPVLVKSVDRAAGVVTLTAPLDRDWPIGTKLHPLTSGRLDDNLPVKNYQDRTIEADVAIALDPGTVRADDVGSPSDVFNKREVFVGRPNFLQPIDGDIRRSIDLVDFGRGRIAGYLPVNFSTRTKQYQMLEAKRADRARVVGLFQRMKGQLGEFYMPSFEDDFTPVGVAVGGSTSATFSGRMLNDVFKKDGVHRAVLITTADGARFYRRILTASLSGSDTVLTTDIGWPVAIDAAVTVSWLVVHRFAVDLLNMDCVTDEAAKAQLSVISLEDLPVTPPDDVFSEIDGAAQWVIDNWGMTFFRDKITDPLDFMVNTEYPYITITIGLIGVGYAADMSQIVNTYSAIGFGNKR